MKSDNQIEFDKEAFCSHMDADAIFVRYLTIVRVVMLEQLASNNGGAVNLTYDDKCIMFDEGVFCKLSQMLFT